MRRAHSIAFQACAAAAVFSALRFRGEKRVIDYRQKRTREQTVEDRLGNGSMKY
jgi:hypothetical protein